ncbi:hypothetical protein ABIF97_003789 [Bradyrhizobium japonicum]
MRTSPYQRQPHFLVPARLLDVVHDIGRQHLGASRNISADHHHDAECAYRVRKSKHGRFNELQSRQRCDDSNEAIQWRNTPCHFQRVIANRKKGVTYRLHDQWQRREHRSDHDPDEGKSERALAPERGENAAGSSGPSRTSTQKPRAAGGSTSGRAISAATASLRKVFERASHQARGTPITRRITVVTLASSIVSAMDCEISDESKSMCVSPPTSAGRRIAIVIACTSGCPAMWCE